MQYNINKDNSTVVSGKTRSREPNKEKKQFVYREHNKENANKNLQRQMESCDNINLQNNSSNRRMAGLVEPIQNLYAFIGKGFLTLVLFWINRKNRFLFFLIHKANTLSDSEVMLRIFNKYYEGCPDKKN